MSTAAMAAQYIHIAGGETYEHAYLDNEGGTIASRRLDQCDAISLPPPLEPAFAVDRSV